MPLYEYKYEYGTRWYPNHGWFRDFSGQCEANVYERALEYIRTKRTIKLVEVKRVAKAALREGRAMT